MKHFTFLTAFLFIAACNMGDDDKPELDHNFRAFLDYKVADFDFSREVDYWEVRRQTLYIGTTATATTTIFSFDLESYATLSDNQITLVSEATSEQGFKYSCLPGACSVFGVVIADENREIISSLDELLLLFGTINTEAELAIWLFANDYQGTSFESNGDGYYAIASWTNHCGLEGSDLLSVDSLGEITVVQKISRRRTNTCA